MVGYLIVKKLCLALVMLALGVTEESNSILDMSTESALVTQESQIVFAPLVKESIAPLVNKKPVIVQKKPSMAVAQAATIAPAAPIGTVGKPIRFTIPKIKVDTKVEYIGLTPAGAIGAPESAYTVSWFTQGARPGEKGSAIISGHSGIWKDGTHSIFDNLKTLIVGDIVKVRDDAGVERSFRIKKMAIYDKDASVPELFQKSDRAYVNIITCYGTWLPSQKTYDRRLIVYTELI